MESYSDHSISVGRELTIRKINTSIHIEVLNIANNNYEIIKNFPMPGRSVRATFSIKY
ncbi:hypothetical protein BFINE_28860 [Bacteroides finegoldii DSM 17565]|nr:hypothetical protein BFINE_28860 [Bacteroides finegoldii DSM 17565]